VVVVCGFFSFGAFAQCPPRPLPDSVLLDAPSIYSQNGTLSAAFTMGHSVDSFGYTHYCYKYQTSTGTEEAPTLRVNPGDTLLLNVTDDINSGSPSSKSTMDMSGAGPICGDGGTPTINSTNVHFHGLNVSPNCGSDDVLDTLIQPGSPGFQYTIKVPADEPPGLYWYHPHVHGFTEFQVNGGAAGAIVVEGMANVRPEVAGLTERVITLRQQFLVPWVPGPYQLTVNFQNAADVNGPAPKILMAYGEKQFWRILNASIQDFIPVQVQFNGLPQPLELIALDGYPLPQTRTETTILIPPAGRAEFIVQAPPRFASAFLVTLPYSTGPTGNPDGGQPLAQIILNNGGTPPDSTKSGASSAVAEPKTLASAQSVNRQSPASQSGASQNSAHIDFADQKKVDGGSSPEKPMHLKFSDLKSATPTTQRKLYFSEEFGGTNGPIQFYITVDGQKQQVFNANEKPVITTNAGAVEDWTIENHALETHDFHIHQIHFMLLEVNGQPVANQDMRDTYQIPYWPGSGPYPSIKVRMDFRDPTITGTFVFHCHILLHEDLGMMHKIEVLPQNQQTK
jgi:FtsP/CotA-like multicopper oxidase with cupredoxin domain